jgi:hypothetical protein
VINNGGTSSSSRPILEFRSDMGHEIQDANLFMLGEI